MPLIVFDRARRCSTIVAGASRETQRYDAEDDEVFSAISTSTQTSSAQSHRYCNLRAEVHNVWRILLSPRPRPRSRASRSVQAPSTVQARAERRYQGTEKRRKVYVSGLAAEAGRNRPRLQREARQGSQIHRERARGGKSDAARETTIKAASREGEMIVGAGIIVIIERYHSFPFGTRVVWSRVRFVCTASACYYGHEWLCGNQCVAYG